MNATMRALYAEDNPQDADLTRAHFESSAPDFELVLVESGEGCLKAVREQAFDVLLLDNHLPDMDGTDVLRRLTEQGSLLPVVMVTGVGNDEIVVQALRAGALDYVPKDGDYLERLPDVLRGVVSEWRDRSLQGRPVGPQVYNVLYVEPHDMDVALTVDHCAEVAPQLRLTVVRTAQEALARLEGEHSFDLVLTDLRTPGMGALELLQHAKHRGVSVPFIVVTGRGDEETAVATLRLGAYDYIVKREGYLTQLAYAIDNAIQRHQLAARSARQHKELIAAKERAESADRLKSMFLSTMSHELRTPLNSIIGFTGILRKGFAGPLNAEQKKQLDFAHEAGQHLLSLINDLLDLSRVEAGRLEVERIPFDFVEIMRQALDGQRPSADARGLKLIAEPATERLPITGDPKRALQVLINLVANAVKFTHAGEVRVTAGQAGRQLHVTVTDTGIGIPSDQQPLLFEAFRQLDGSARRVYEGTGLGLYLCRKLLTLMGGEIGMHSEPGKGSAFSFWLPLDPAVVTPVHVEATGTTSAAVTPARVESPSASAAVTSARGLP